MTYERRFQVLDYVFEVKTPCREVAELVEFIARDVEQPWEPRWTITFSVSAAARGYDLFEDGEPLARGIWAGAVVEQIQLRITRIVFTRLGDDGWVAVHAGAADIHGRRVLVTGEKGAGKTSLLVRLLLDGAEVQGDDVTLIGSDGSTLPYPRRFHLKDGIDQIVPELTAVLPTVPTLHYGEFRVWAWPPPGSWQVDWAPVDAIVLLEKSDDATSRLVPFPSYRAAQHLMSHLMVVPSGRGWITDICRLVAGAACYRLLLGDLRQAADLVSESLPLGRPIWEHA